MRATLRKAMGMGVLGLVCGGWFVFLGARSGHRAPPSPKGLVLRLETREVFTPWDRVAVYAVQRDGPAIVVLTPGVSEFPAKRELYRYPDGKLLEPMGPETTPAAMVRGDFDFDGDGVADKLENGPDEIESAEYGIVRVYSGRDGRLLFEDRDELEYEGSRRASPLPDLEGDGCSELALLHPRMDRSAYDFELWDMLFGAKSWVSIVSGARATR